MGFRTLFVIRAPGFSGASSFALLLALFFWASGAFAMSSGGGAADRTLKVAYVEFPPLSYRDEYGKAAGTMVDITRKVAEKAAYELKFVYLPVSRVYLYLRNGKVDLWMGMTNIPSLSMEVLESWVSPLLVRLSAWYLDGTPPVDHLDRLRNTTVILHAGYTYGDLRTWLQEQSDIRVLDAPNHRAAIDMLERGRGDYVLDYHQPVTEMLTRPGDERVRESRIRSRHTAWLFSLARPGAALVRDDFDNAYIELAKQGAVPPLRSFGRNTVVPGFPEGLQ